MKYTEDEDGNEITTDEASAEKYGMQTLLTTEGVHIGEDISVYGYVPGSRYFAIDEDLPVGQVFVTSSYADKFSLKVGDEITLKEEYLSTTYTFTVEGIYEMPGVLGVIMPLSSFCEVFDEEETYFTGYFASNEITDIDEEDIAAVITVEDILKMARQLDHSIGNYMTYFSVICGFVALLVMYLLTKQIIEANATSISMIKVLGYYNKEVNRLYVWLTTIVVVISAVLTAFISMATVRYLWRYIMYGMSGWFLFEITARDIAIIIGVVVLAYIVVACMDLRRIRKVPLTVALKDAE